MCVVLLKVVALEFLVKIIVCGLLWFSPIPGFHVKTLCLCLCSFMFSLLFPFLFASLLWTDPYSRQTGIEARFITSQLVEY